MLSSDEGIHKVDIYIESCALSMRYISRPQSGMQVKSMWVTKLVLLKPFSSHVNVVLMAGSLRAWLKSLLGKVQTSEYMAVGNGPGLSSGLLRKCCHLLFETTGPLPRLDLLLHSKN